MRKRSLKKKSRSSIFKPLEELCDLEKCLNILKVLPDIIYHIDPTGHFTFLSNSVDTLGYKPDELIGKHFSTIVHTDDVRQFGRQHILPKYKGKITGDENAPKLFDERRTGKRKTSGLEVRLLPKRKNKMIFGEVIAIGDISSTGHYDRLANTKSKKFLGTIGIIRDITAKRESEAKLHYQADMLEHVSDAIVSTDLNFNIRTWNNAAEKMYGWEFIEVEGKPVRKVTKLRYPYDNQDKVVKQFFKEGNWKGEVIQQTRDGRTINVQTSVVLIKDCGGNPIGAVAVNRDITDRRTAETKLRNSETKYRSIVENTGVGVATTNVKGEFTFVNNRLCQMIGYRKKELLGKPFADFLHPADKNGILNIFFRAFKNPGANVDLEFRVIHKNGKTIHMYATPTFYKDQDTILGFNAIIQNITELKKTGEQIRQSLKEKEALLKELHHRVKNNLQIISSLLNLQSSQTNDDSVRNILLESQNRVKTMVLIHEKLYQSKDLSHVNANHYINSIFQYLFDSYGVRQNRINRVINIDSIDLDIDTAIPCGLIINELVSNAIKYAFPSDLKNRKEKPEVNIEMHKVKQEISLVIADNGIGIDFDPKNSTKTTLGLQLVHALVDQIDGKITWEKNNGTKVTIICPAIK